MMKPTLHLLLFLLVTPACSICHRRRRPWQGLVAYRDDDPESQSATSVEMSDVVDKRVPKAEEQDKDNKPLQSEPVALPKLTEEPKLPWAKSRSFDTVPLPATRQARARPARTETPARRKGPTSGTRFDLRFPSKEKIIQWFAPSQEKTSSKQLFNHDSVGMTNPVLSVNLNNNNHHQDTDLQSVSLASSDNKLELEESWIPATSTNPQQQQPQGARVLQYKLKTPESSHQDAQHAWFPPTSPSNRRKWRLCRFRRRVGQGQACYERVKEAALEWQFQNAPQNKGILPVEQRANDDDNGFSFLGGNSPTVQPLWSGPHTQASRRLVTYTRTGFKSKWLPKLYTLNPVMVVYDLLDQRGPATTYTSTAYATLKGHLLSGEERVTVAYRDGTGFVDVEIVSYSRPAASLKGKLVWPLIGGMQQAFFQQQMDYLEQVANAEDAVVAPR